MIHSSTRMKSIFQMLLNCEILFQPQTAFTIAYDLLIIYDEYTYIWF